MMVFTSIMTVIAMLVSNWNVFICVRIIVPVTQKHRKMNTVQLPEGELNP